ncbi:MAG: PAS domain S-box protein, partial [Desulfobacteraceae bacterium]
SGQTGQPALVLTRPFEGGVLLGYLDLATLNSITDKSVIGSTGFAAIVDRQGTYIAHPNRRLVFEQLNVKNLDVVRRGLAGEEGTFQYEAKGVSMLGSVARVPQTGWLVTVVQPEEEAFTRVDRIRTIFWGGSSLAVLLALLAALASLRKTLRPMGKLVQEARHMAGGNYDVRPEPGDYKEFQELAEGFQTMAKAVHVRETALRESEEKYRLLVDNMNDLVIEFDDQRRLLFGSPSVYELFGFTEEEFLGQDLTRFVDSSHQDEISEFLDRIQHPPYTAFYEERASTQKGLRWLAWSARATLDADGRVNSVISVGRDITEQKIAEERVRRSERQFRDLFNSISDIVYTQDMQGRFLKVNPSLLQLFGYDEEEIIGRPASDFMKPEIKSLFQKEYLEALRTKGYHEGISLYFTKEGKRLYLEYRSVRIRPDDGEPYISGTGRDVTEKIAAERKIQQLQDQMIQAKKMEAIGTLAGGIAHDFNNLLMGIQGNASLMLLETPAGHPHQHKLKGIEQYVRSGAELTRQLLGFARGGKYEVKPIDLNDLVQQSAEMFGRTRKEIVLRMTFQESLWVVEADRTQIEQVLLNLYVNAWQSMPSGGTLHLETENVELSPDDVEPHQVDPGRFVRITVRDTGMGMDEDTRERIFEPFFTSKEMGRGTGLGLASVYGIVKNHGGFISVESEKGEGATFHLYFPATEGTVQEERAPRKELALGSGTVLIVDDEQLILSLGKEMLKRLGYEVITASSGEEALRVVSEQGSAIDVVILDMIMPGTGGGEVFDRLREIDPHIRVLLSSGYSVDGNAQAILDRGCNGFLQKPFDLQELSEKLKEVL